MILTTILFLLSGTLLQLSFPVIASIAVLGPTAVLLARTCRSCLRHRGNNVCRDAVDARQMLPAPSSLQFASQEVVSEPRTCSPSSSSKDQQPKQQPIEVPSMVSSPPLPSGTGIPPGRPGQKSNARAPTGAQSMPKSRKAHSKAAPQNSTADPGCGAENKKSDESHARATMVSPGSTPSQVIDVQPNCPASEVFGVADSSRPLRKPSSGPPDVVSSPCDKSNPAQGSIPPEVSSLKRSSVPKDFPKAEAGPPSSPVPPAPLSNPVLDHSAPPFTVNHVRVSEMSELGKLACSTMPPPQVQSFSGSVCRSITHDSVTSYQHPSAKELTDAMKVKMTKAGRLTSATTKAAAMLGGAKNLLKKSFLPKASHEVPRVMISDMNGDRSYASVFRRNKVSPKPVLYAVVHPKPAPAEPASPPILESKVSKVKVFASSLSSLCLEEDWSLRDSVQASPECQQRTTPYQRPFHSPLIPFDSSYPTMMGTNLQPYASGVQSPYWKIQGEDTVCPVGYNVAAAVAAQTESKGADQTTNDSIFEHSSLVDQLGLPSHLSFSTLGTQAKPLDTSQIESPSFVPQGFIIPPGSTPRGTQPPPANDRRTVKHDDLSRHSCESIDSLLGMAAAIVARGFDSAEEFEADPLSPAPPRFPALDQMKLQAISQVNWSLNAESRVMLATPTLASTTFSTGTRRYRRTEHATRYTAASHHARAAAAAYAALDMQRGI
eukprot:gene16633-22881_t